MEDRRFNNSEIEKFLLDYSRAIGKDSVEKIKVKSVNPVGRYVSNSSGVQIYDVDYNELTKDGGKSFTERYVERFHKRRDAERMKSERVFLEEIAPHMYDDGFVCIQPVLEIKEHEGDVIYALKYVGRKNFAQDHLSVNKEELYVIGELHKDNPNCLREKFEEYDHQIKTLKYKGLVDYDDNEVWLSGKFFEKFNCKSEYEEKLPIFEMSSDYIAQRNEDTKNAFALVKNFPIKAKKILNGNNNDQGIRSVNENFYFEKLNKSLTRLDFSDYDNFKRIIDIYMDVHVDEFLNLSRKYPSLQHGDSHIWNLLKTDYGNQSYVDFFDIMYETPFSDLADFGLSSSLLCGIQSDRYELEWRLRAINPELDAKKDEELRRSALGDEKLKIPLYFKSLVESYKLFRFYAITKSLSERGDSSPHTEFAKDEAVIFRKELKNIYQNLDNFIGLDEEKRKKIRSLKDLILREDF